MSEKVYSLRINDEELETWIEDTVPKGELNPLLNTLLMRYRDAKNQEYIELQMVEKAETNSYIFQMVMFMMIGCWMLVFALSQYFDILGLLSTVLLLISGVLLCFYVLMRGFKQKEVKEAVN